MDLTNALEAVEAIRGTVPEADQAQFDTELAARLGLVGEVAGPIAVDAALEARPDPVDAKEAITGQLDTSFAGYLSEVEQINKNRDEADKIEAGDEKRLTTEFESWFSQPRQKYMAEAMEADPELSFTLVAVPNETVTVDEVLEDARDFGEDQPHPTMVYPEVISQYSAAEISGTNPKNGNKFKFVAIPSKFTPALYGKVNFQKDGLTEMREDEDAPFLEAPTPLVGMTFLRTRRAMGDKLVGSGTDDATYLRCFDMEPKPIGGFERRCVPYLIVFDRGQLVVGGSGVGLRDDGRVLAG